MRCIRAINKSYCHSSLQHDHCTHSGRLAAGCSRKVDLGHDHVEPQAPRDSKAWRPAGVSQPLPNHSHFEGERHRIHQGERTYRSLRTTNVPPTACTRLYYMPAGRFMLTAASNNLRSTSRHPSPPSTSPLLNTRGSQSHHLLLSHPLHTPAHTGRTPASASWPHENCNRRSTRYAQRPEKARDPSEPPGAYRGGTNATDRNSNELRKALGSSMASTRSSCKPATLLRRRSWKTRSRRRSKSYSDHETRSRVGQAKMISRTKSRC